MSTKEEFKTTYIGEHTDKESWKSFKFIVTINGHDFPYYMGSGHAKFMTNSELSKLKESGQAYTILERDVKIQPIRHEVLPHPTQLDVEHALYSDMQLGLEIFADFCSNLGYDTDSRKALASYLECQDTAVKMRNYNFQPEIINGEY